MSPAGLAFLKCAFSPPDFTSTGVQGVPDDFRGLSLLKKHRTVQPSNFTTGSDYYIILAPVPGIAFFTASSSAGVAIPSTVTFDAVPYSDYTSLFGTNAYTTDQQVNSFRFISNHIEFVSTTNEMSWSGSLQVWKVPLKLKIRTSGDPNNLYTIDGLDGVNSTSANRYVGRFTDGAYAGAYNMSPEFMFNSILTNLFTCPATIGPDDFGQFHCLYAIPGFDNGFESVIIKLSGLTTDISCIIRTWACVEYTVDPLASIYEYQTNSPQADPVAMKIYRETCLSLPVAVMASENANFWSRVLSIIRTLSSVGSLIPGPYGSISMGVNAIANGLTELTL